MDWFTWLSKTGLDPSLVYEYGLVFSHNELEEEDIKYFNHEFLMSMGISIAKHRLEILKLARKKLMKKGMMKKSTTIRPVSRLILHAIKKTRKCFSSYLRTMIGCEESALAVVPISRPSSGSYGSTTRWKSAMIKRNKNLMVMSNISNSNNNSFIKQQERLLLTNGSPMLVPALPGPEGFIANSPMVYNNFHKEEKIHVHVHDHDHDHDDGYWSTAVEDIRWDTMFQDLKPN